MKSNYTYRMFRKDINTILRKINKAGDKFDYVVGVSRGGLLAATVLSHRLKTQFHAINKPYSSSLSDIKNLIYSGNKILLVEDIIDTGKTVIFIRDFLDTDLLKIATLIHNTDIELDCYSGTKISRKRFTRWVTFFWEI